MYMSVKLPLEDLNSDPSPPPYKDLNLWSDYHDGQMSWILDSTLQI